MASKQTPEALVAEQAENVPSEAIEAPTKALEAIAETSASQEWIELGAGESYGSVADRLAKGDVRKFAEKLAQANRYTPTGEGIRLVVPAE
jgi:hypothetical protein